MCTPFNYFVEAPFVLLQQRVYEQGTSFLGNICPFFFAKDHDTFSHLMCFYKIHQGLGVFLCKKSFCFALMLLAASLTTFDDENEFI